MQPNAKHILQSLFITSFEPADNTGLADAALTVLATEFKAEIKNHDFSKPLTNKYVRALTEKFNETSSMVEQFKEILNLVVRMYEQYEPLYYFVKDAPAQVHVDTSEPPGTFGQTGTTSMLMLVLAWLGGGVCLMGIVGLANSGMLKDYSEHKGVPNRRFIRNGQGRNESQPHLVVTREIAGLLDVWGYFDSLAFLQPIRSRIKQLTKSSKRQTRTQ